MLLLKILMINDLPPSHFDFFVLINTSVIDNLCILFRSLNVFQCNCNSLILQSYYWNWYKLITLNVFQCNCYSLNLQSYYWNWYKLITLERKMSISWIHHLSISLLFVWYVNHLTPIMFFSKLLIYDIFFEIVMS